MIIADAHVHIHDCFDLGKFLDAAYSNFQAEAGRLCHSNNFTRILLLTETDKDYWFNLLSKIADGNNTDRGKVTKTWEFYHTGEDVSLSARSGRKSLIIIAGRQVETAEGLEVLALSTISKFRSRIPIIDLIKEVKKQDAIPVIPWGFGKWLGSRGKILNSLIKIQKDLKFYLGDNSGRPAFLPFPRHFKIAEIEGIHILPGSDSLPFSTEYNRAGRFGFILEKKISDTYPAKSLKQILMNPKLKVQSYGDLENPFWFFHNQLKMQIKKQYSKHNTINL